MSHRYPQHYEFKGSRNARLSKKTILKLFGKCCDNQDLKMTDENYYLSRKRRYDCVNCKKWKWIFLDKKNVTAASM